MNFVHRWSCLQGYSEAILDDIVQTKEEIDEFVQIIYDESVRLGKLVNELLDLARMESGHVELHIGEVDIHPFVEKIGRKFQGIAKDKEVELTVDFRNQIEEYAFDADRMEQVLTNLIDNAIRHTNAGGHVTLVIDTKIMASFLKYKIRVGIPEEDIPFYLIVSIKLIKQEHVGKRVEQDSGLQLRKILFKAMTVKFLYQVLLEKELHSLYIYRIV